MTYQAWRNSWRLQS